MHPHPLAGTSAYVRVADLGGEKLHGPLGGLRPGAGGGAGRVIH